MTTERELKKQLSYTFDKILDNISNGELSLSGLPEKLLKATDNSNDIV